VDSLSQVKQVWFIPLIPFEKWKKTLLKRTTAAALLCKKHVDLKHVFWHGACLKSSFKVVFLTSAARTSNRELFDFEQKLFWTKSFPERKMNLVTMRFFFEKSKKNEIDYYCLTWVINETMKIVILSKGFVNKTKEEASLQEVFGIWVEFCSYI